MAKERVPVLGKPKQKPRRALSNTNLTPDAVHLFDDFFAANPPLSVDRDFFMGDVLDVCPMLLGQLLCVRDPRTNRLVAGRIVEVEAYRAPEDEASHAYQYKRTSRNESMYCVGGTSYVYVCYGIHTMMNIATGPVDAPHAILIRALEPIAGLDQMLMRRPIKTAPRTTAGQRTAVLATARGPGCLSAALDIRRDMDGLDMVQFGARTGVLFVARCPSFDDIRAFALRQSFAARAAVEEWALHVWSHQTIVEGPRIGIQNTGPAVAYPYRFFFNNHPAVSRRNTGTPLAFMPFREPPMPNATSYTEEAQPSASSSSNIEPMPPQE